MRCNVLPVALAFFAVAGRILAQCSDPCTVEISVDAATAFQEDSDISAAAANAALTSIDDAAILGDDDSDPPDRRRALRRRQDSTSVCCNADETCLSSDGTPFCFNPATTEIRAGDGSYGFIANSSYYASNGSLIDSSTGATLPAGGSTEASAPTSAAMSMASGLGSSTIAGSTEASAPTSAAISMASSPGSSTIGATTSSVKSGSAAGPSSLSSATVTNSAPGISTESEPATVSSSSAQATGQASSGRVESGKLVAAAGLVILWIVDDLGDLM